MKKYKCEICDYIYDPEVGDEEHGIPAGTRFEDLPEDWECPDCGVSKNDFSVFEE
jgi:rubredoxin